MRRWPVLYAGLMLIAGSSISAAEGLMSPEYGRCVDKSGGITVDMLDCDAAEMQRQDKRLNVAYQKLMKNGSDEQKSALRDGQRSWLAYRKGNCGLVYRFGGGGTLDSISASGCELDVLAQRVKFLETLSSD